MGIHLLRHCDIHNTNKHKRTHIVYTAAQAAAKWPVERIQGSAGKQDSDIKPDVSRVAM